MGTSEGWGLGCHTKEDLQTLQASAEVGLISEVLSRLEKAVDVEASEYIRGGERGGGVGVTKSHRNLSASTEVTLLYLIPEV